MNFKDKIVYLAGPMSGLPNYNREAFFAEEKILQKGGAIVLNPATSPDGLRSHDSYMRIALAMLGEADLMVVLPGWEKSVGVAMEMDFAAKNKIPTYMVSGDGYFGYAYGDWYSPTKPKEATAAPSALDTQVGGDHYKSCAIQPVQFIEANELKFLEGCIVKRVTRHDKPTGKGEQDIRKAIHELTLLLELRYTKAVTF
jgi:hypothetical protein